MAAVALVTLAVGAGIVALSVADLLNPPAGSIQAVTSRGLDDEYRPLEPTGIFTPDETFYLSVRAERIPAGSILNVRWYYGSSLIHSQDQIIRDSEDIHVIGFELSRTDEPWPPGAYHVQLLINGSPVGTAQFSVVAATEIP
jgi:hypothetical protein